MSFVIVCDVVVFTFTLGNLILLLLLVLPIFVFDLVEVVLIVLMACLSKSLDCMFV